MIYFRFGQPNPNAPRHDGPAGRGVASLMSVDIKPENIRNSSLSTQHDNSIPGKRHQAPGLQSPRQNAPRLKKPPAGIPSRQKGELNANLEVEKGPTKWPAYNPGAGRGGTGGVPQSEPDHTPQHGPAQSGSRKPTPRGSGAASARMPHAPAAQGKSLLHKF